MPARRRAIWGYIGGQDWRAVVLASLVSAAVTMAAMATLHPWQAGAQAAQQGQIRAESLTLVGRNGLPRIVLGEGPEGEAGLRVYSKDGTTPRFELGVSVQDLAGFLAYGSNGRPRVAFAEEPDGGVGLSGRDVNGAIRFELFFTGETVTSLRLLDRAGKVKVRLFEFDDGGSGLILRDPQERDRVLVRVALDGTPVVTLLNENGQQVASLP